MRNSISLQVFSYYLLLIFFLNTLHGMSMLSVSLIESALHNLLLMFEFIYSRIWNVVGRRVFWIVKARY